MSDFYPFPTHPYRRTPPLKRRGEKMKVLVFGLPRTGTTSLCAALNELGYNSYSMTECCLNHRSDSLRHWLAAIDAKYNNKGLPYRGAQFDAMLSRYDAVTGFPGILFVEELMDAYPDAVIILTTRWTDGWLRSVQRTLRLASGLKRLWLLSWFDITYIDRATTLLRTSLKIITGKHREGGNPNDPERLLSAYHSHNAHVQGAALARNRPVLEYRVEDGWGPLCWFLNKPRPDSLFPRLSQGDSVRQYLYLVFWCRVVELGAPLVVGMVGLYALALAWGVHVQLVMGW
ncbi:hypothetical protein BJX70DRAFT_396072 [Aspergillus crustosus]